MCCEIPCDAIVFGVTIRQILQTFVTDDRNGAHRTTYPKDNSFSEFPIGIAL